MVITSTPKEIFEMHTMDTLQLMMINSFLQSSSIPILLELGLLFLQNHFNFFPFIIIIIYYIWGGGGFAKLHSRTIRSTSTMELSPKCL